MAGKNSQLHCLIETNLKTKIVRQANDMGLSISELIRRKFEDPTTPEETIILRKLKEAWENGKKK